MAQQVREEAGGEARQGDGEGAERGGQGPAEGGGQARVGGGQEGHQGGARAGARQLHEGRRESAHQALLLLSCPALLSSSTIISPFTLRRRRWIVHRFASQEPPALAALLCGTLVLVLYPHVWCVVVPFRSLFLSSSFLVFDFDMEYIA